VNSQLKEVATIGSVREVDAKRVGGKAAPPREASRRNWCIGISGYMLNDVAGVGRGGVIQDDIVTVLDLSLLIAR